MLSGHIYNIILSLVHLYVKIKAVRLQPIAKPLYYCDSLIIACEHTFIYLPGDNTYGQLSGHPSFADDTNRSTHNSRRRSGAPALLFCSQSVASKTETHETNHAIERVMSLSHVPVVGSFDCDGSRRSSARSVRM
jgi:hypothetical protein